MITYNTLHSAKQIKIVRLERGRKTGKGSPSQAGGGIILCTRRHLGLLGKARVDAPNF